MTPREVFEKIAAHLLAQGKKSLLGPSWSICAYRGHDGTKCAVGCLIPDERYVHTLEGLEALYPTITDILDESGIDTSDALTREVLGDTQRIHDNSEPDQWPAKLDELRKLLFPEAT